MQKREKGAKWVSRSAGRGQIPPRRQKDEGVRHCRLCPSGRAQDRAAEDEGSGHADHTEGVWQQGPEKGSSVPPGPAHTLAGVWFKLFRR